MQLYTNGDVPAQDKFLFRSRLISFSPTTVVSQYIVARISAVSLNLTASHETHDVFSDAFKQSRWY